MECGIKLHDVKRPVASLPNKREIQNFIVVAWIFFRTPLPPKAAAALTWRYAAFKNKSPCHALSTLPLLVKSWGYI